MGSGQPPPKGGALLSEQQFHKVLDALNAIINGTGDPKKEAEEARKVLLKAAKGEYD